MKKKALMTWLLVMLLAAGSLAACGPKQSAEPAPADTAATEDSTAAEDTAAPEDTAATQDTAAPAAETAAEDGEITADRAKEIALADAGVDAANAVFKKAQIDIDDGVRQYEVEFFANDMEYSYDIEAATGNILSRESEAMDAEDYQEMEALK